LNNIQRRVAENYLKSIVNANKKARKITSFQQIKTIGILYDASDEKNIQEVKLATKKLNALGKEIYTLGYINKKTIPLDLEPHTKDDYYCKKDLHWYQLPIKERISRFANENFDYLLNVYTANQLPLIGVSAMSKANCRLGTFHKRYTACFDIMMDEKGTMSITDLLDAFLLNLYKLKNETP
jgi:hypothetical protein